MSTSLKQELKAWEAQFRQENGRDPNKTDIKANLDIAKKYKEYSKSKQPPPPPLVKAPPVFKTPTKPRPSTSRQSHSTSSDAVTVAHSTTTNGGSPTKRLSANGKSKEPQYVLANSPSKLRALAAMHSTSGSPNRPSGPNWLTASTSASTSSTSHSKPAQSKSKSLQQPPLASTNTSPRKALNPFASPKKRETVVIAPPSRGTTLFGEFEKQERDRMKKKKKQGGIKVKSGMGWGHASDAIDRGTGMELDEVDSFFGASPSSSSAKPIQPSTMMANPFLSPAPVVQVEEEEEDDELLGPSPVKPPSQFRRSLSSTSFGFDSSTINKPFKPLFGDPPPASTSSQSQSQSQSKEVEMKPSAPPKLFETSLRTGRIDSVEPTNVRGLKRSTSSGAGVLKKKGSGGGVDEMDGLLEDGDDDFYADALDSLEKGDSDDGKKGKGGKRKRVTAARGRGRGKGKGKGKARDEEQVEEEELDDEVRVERDGRGGLVLDLRVDGVEGEEGGETRERIKVHQQGRDRRARGRPREEGEGMEVDQEGEGQDEEEFARDDGYLLSRPQNRSIVSSERPRPAVSPPPPALGASLPTDLASLLSIRASPTKSTETAKDRQVAKLLREPTELARQRKRGGLLELADEEVGNEDEDEGEEEIEGDDDWDEEVDGWKQAGDAMDGYYSGGDDW
ncbi:hypothetical protein JCM5353_004187 [Sporobolomyces roseus]